MISEIFSNWFEIYVWFKFKSGFWEFDFRETEGELWGVILGVFGNEGGADFIFDLWAVVTTTQGILGLEGKKVGLL